MVFDFNKCLTATLLAIALLSVAYIFESNKSNSYAGTAAYSGGEIVSYNMCLINDTPTTLTFPLITKATINSLKLVSLDSVIDSYVTSSISFDPTDFITYNEYNIYNFSLTVASRNPYNKGFNLSVPNLVLNINDKKYTYDTPDFSLCNDAYVSENRDYKINSDELVISDTNTAYYTLPTSDNPASVTLTTKSDVTLINMKSSDFLSINDFTINSTPADAQSIYMKLRKDHKFKVNYSLNYTDYKHTNKIVKSSMIIKYKINDDYYVYISNTPLYVFPGYSKNYAMERYIDTLKH